MHNMNNPEVRNMCMAKLSELSNDEAIKVHVALEKLNLAIAEAESSKDSMSNGSDKFCEKLKAIKQHAYMVIIDKTVSLSDKENQIKSKVKELLKPSVAKRVWRKIKDVLSVFKPSFYTKKTGQTFWQQATKTKVEMEAAKSIKHGMMATAG